MIHDAPAATPTADWEAAETKRLSALWSEGHTARVIAGKLNAEFRNGRTKMAVTGKANRIGLPPRSLETNRLQGKINGKARLALSTEPSPERKAGLGKVWIKAPRLLPGQTLADGFLITEIPGGGCKYALTANAPHRFCGRSAELGKSYCAKHLKGLHQPGSSTGNPHARETAKDKAR